MTRRKLPQMTQEDSIDLDTLLSDYVGNNEQKKALEKIVSTQGTKIKQILTDEDKTEYIGEDYSAKLSISSKIALNEDKMLMLFASNPELAEIAKKYNIVKTKMVIDENALENATFKNAFSEQMLLELDNCIEKTKVTKLYVSKTKKESKYVH